MDSEKQNSIRLFAAFYLVIVASFSLGFSSAYHKTFPWSIYKEFYDFLSHEDATIGKTNIQKIAHRLNYAHQERRSIFDFKGFNLRDKDFLDDGYILVSRFSKEHDQSIVELFSIDKRKVLHRWIPPLDTIFAKTPKTAGTLYNTRDSFCAAHPLLLPNGDIIFHNGVGPMVRLDKSGKLIWAIDRKFHHSIEMDEKNRIVAPLVMPRDKSVLRLPIQNDGFAFVSLDGQIEKEYSIASLLLENKYDHLLLGVGRFEHDKIHLNDAQPILRDSGMAKKGDIALSIRNLSTIALFRPKSGKIIWIKTGPWMNQHDINHLDDGRFSIFSNNSARFGKKFSLPTRQYSDIYIYNPETEGIETPYSNVMESENISTLTEGLATILHNGDAFVEEQNTGRLLRISKTGVRWEYVNSISENTVGLFHWCRYIPAGSLDLKWKEDNPCQ